MRSFEFVKTVKSRLPVKLPVENIKGLVNGHGLVNGGLVNGHGLVNGGLVNGHGLVNGGLVNGGLVNAGSFINNKTCVSLWNQINKGAQSQETLLKFMAAFAASKDKARIIAVHHILSLRKKREPWSKDIYIGLLNAYSAVRNHRKVLEIYGFMYSVDPSPNLDVFDPVLLALLELNIHPQIVLICNIVMAKNLHLSLRCYSVFIKSFVLQSNLPKLKSLYLYFLEKDYHIETWEVIHTQFLAAFAALKSELNFAQSLLFYKTARSEKLNLLSNSSILKYLHSSEFRKSFQKWNHKEFPVSILQIAAGYFASSNMSKLYDFFVQYVFTNVLVLHWAHQMYKSHKNYSNDLKRAQEEFAKLPQKIGTRHIELGNAISKAKKQINGGLPLVVGIGGPLNAVYLAAETSYLSTLADQKDHVSYGFKVAEFHKLQSKLELAELAFLKKSVIAEYLVEDHLIFKP